MTERNRTLDTVRGILVILMTLAHLLMFFPEWNGTEELTAGINLISFTGFMFCSGISCYLAYLNNYHGGNRKRILKAALKILLCYYISALAYQYFVAKEWGTAVLRDVLLFRVMPGYSEFLLPFFCQYILLLFFRKGYQWVSYHSWKLLAASLIGLLFTAVKAPAGSGGLLGTLLGSTEFFCFPLLPYSCAFWLGVYLIKRDKGFDLRLTAAGIVILIASAVMPGQLNRFPPTALYILKGLTIVYLFYSVLRVLMQLFPELGFPVLRAIGRNSLLLLVAGNAAIFRLWSTLPEGSCLGTAGYLKAVTVLVLLFAGCMALKALFTTVKKLL